MTDTFAFIHELTGFSGDDLRVVTDGIDLFWTSNDDSGSIYKYDVSDNSHAKLVDSSSFDPPAGSVGTLNAIQLAVFRSNIYVAAKYTGGSQITEVQATVFKVTPSGTVSTVLPSFPKTTALGNGHVTLPAFEIFSTETHVVAVWTENAFGGDTPEFLSQYSTNGSLWITTTNTFSETIGRRAINNSFAANHDMRQLGIHQGYTVDGSNTLRIIAEFNNGTWSKLAGPLGNGIFEVGPVHIWTRDDFAEYTNDYVNFFSPVGANPATVTLNMPYSVINDDIDFDEFLRLNPSVSPTARTTDSTMVGEETTIGSEILTMVRLNSGKTLLVVEATGATSPDWSIWERDNDLPATPSAWGGGGGKPSDTIPLPASINADGTFIYIAFLSQLGIPFLGKVNTDLTPLTEGSFVFNPGEGSRIGVICGRQNADTLWIGGDFSLSGTSSVLQKSTDAGGTFEEKSDGTFGAIRVFTVGPDSDDRVLVVDDNVNIEETLDSGTTWTNINTGVGFPPFSLARLAIDVKETVFGNGAAAADNIDYSLDSGANMEDFTTGVFPITDTVKSVIVN